MILTNQSTAGTNKDRPGDRIKIAFRNGILTCMMLALVSISAGFAQGAHPYYWAASLADQFGSLPHEGYREHDSDVLAFTFWQGGSSFIGEDPENEMHMQAIARYDVAGVPYFFVSRNGNPFTLGTDHPGELVVVRMSSQSGSDGEALGETCNLNDGDHCKPNSTDKTVYSYIFTSGLPPDEDGRTIGWKHAGGMQVFDHYLLVALEKTCNTEEDPDYPDDEKYRYYCTDSEVDRGAIAIFDLQNIDHCPTSGCLELEKLVTKYTNADGDEVDLPTMGAVGVTKRETASGTEYLFTHSAGNMNAWTFLTSPALDGPLAYASTVNIDEKYIQNVNFVHSVLDGKLYLVATRSSSSTPGGTDYADLYQVGTTPSLTLVQELHIYLEQADGITIGDFTAVGGVYASPSGRLILYSGPYDNNGWNLTADGCVNPAHTELCKAVEFGELVSDFGTPPYLNLLDQNAESGESDTFYLGSFTDDYIIQASPPQYIGCIDYTARIDWGDGTPRDILSLTRPLNYPSPVQPVPVEAEHTFGAAGTYTGTVEIEDCDGFLTQESFQTSVLDINDAPAGADNSITTLENTPYTFQVSDFGFSDPNDSPSDNFDRLKITTVPLLGSLTLSGVNVLAGDFIDVADIPSMSFSPAANANGDPYTSFTFQVQDDGGTSNGGVDLDPTPNTLTLIVTAVNGEPSFTSSGDVSVLEDSGSYSAIWATDINDGDPDVTQVLTFAITNNTNSSLFNAGPSIAGDGTLTFTPADNANASAIISVELRDDGGIANGGDNTSSSVDFTISVTAVNDEPSFTSGAIVSVLEDSGSYSAIWATDIDDGDPDVTQVLTFAITNNTNSSLFNAGPSIASDGTLTFTPAVNANGSAIISVELRDDGGTANDGDNTFGPVDFFIVVTAVNDEPSFTSGGDVSVLEDSGSYSAIWATDINDGDPNDAQTLTFVITNNTNPGLFSAGPSIAGNGTLMFTPADNAYGSATISVELLDSGSTAFGGDNTYGPVDFTITVTNINDPPTDILLDNNAIAENEPVGTAVGSLTTSDLDPTDIHTYTLVTGVAGCDSSGNASFQIGGTSNNELQTAVIFDYETSLPSLNVCIQTEDNGGERYTEQFTIAITNVNDAPVNSVPGSQTTADGTPLTFSTAQVNPIFVSDEDAGVLDLEITLSVTNGLLSLYDTSDLSFTVGTGADNASMTFTGTLARINAAMDGMIYMPNVGYTGGDILTVTSDDQGHTGTGGAQTDTDTVGITVAAVPPIVLTDRVDSNPSTPDGMLSPGEVLPSLTQIIIPFSEDMDDNTPGDEVTNVANYLLLYSGSDNTFQTGDCDQVKSGPGIDPADQIVPISSITYNLNTFTATLNFSAVMPNGLYRIYACGCATLRDRAGVALAGDGSNPGTDFTLDFRIKAVVVDADLLPSTGFAPGLKTPLPAQPARKAYADTSMTLEIQDIGVVLPIVGVPQNENSWDVTWLGDNAGWLSGSAYPTWAGNTVITGHVWDANNRPGPFVNLKSLGYGSQIAIHAWGQTYIYEVRDNCLLLPDQISTAFQHEEYDWITLITCERYNHSGGDYLFRRAVRAVLVGIK